ncbi:MAG TPA: TlpA disulfide reductase family protein [Bryobacteraceae bacterium]|nr:TlpA disulfide reductase family protein [Bryobacteraceae bacterium]
MRIVFLIGAVLPVLNAVAASPASGLWDELQAKRQQLSSFHEEFDVSRTLRGAHGEQGSKWQVIVDISHDLWRERSIAGYGDDITIFNGDGRFFMEQGGDEYTRTKVKSNDFPQPSPYDLKYSDWSHATEIERRPCGIPNADHPCVILQAAAKPRMIEGGRRITGGSVRVLMDLETGLLLSSRNVMGIENSGNGYQVDVIYTWKKLNYGAPADASLFRLPSADMREVKKLSEWRAAQIRKRFAGQPAPEFNGKDISGKPIRLAHYKGKTVLLDFFTTWCPPCRADGPALDKLYQKYSDKDLAIIGISVSEDRGIVEKFLGQHPHPYPIVLTSENEMPRPYQIGVFPTYIVIDKDGTLTAAVEGDAGFGELRKLLRKAGMEAD